MDNQNPEEDLRALAKKYLNATGIKTIEGFLSHGEYNRAQLCILGAIDRMFADKNISPSEASEAYKKLGLPLEKIFKVRNTKT